MKELDSEILIELKTKKSFVNSLKETLVTHIPSIVNVEYVVLVSEEFEGFYIEFIKITYKGGGHTVRNSSHNSLSAIFREISNLLNGGYYKENEYYDTLLDKGWKEIDY